MMTWQYSGFQSSLSVYVHTVFNQQKMGVQMSEDQKIRPGNNKNSHKKIHNNIKQKMSTTSACNLNNEI